MNFRATLVAALLPVATATCTVPTIGTTEGTYTPAACVGAPASVTTGTECTITAKDGYTCTSPGKCLSTGIFAATGECKACALNCKVCDKAGAGKCDTCNTGFTVVGDVCKAVCDSPTIAAGVETWTTSPAVATGAPGKNCGSGVAGVLSGSKCGITAKSGYTCTSPGLCTGPSTAANKGFAGAGSCTACIAGCDTCPTDPTSKCDTCLVGFRLKTDKSACEACAANCKKCETAGAGKCDTCNTGYTVNADKSACEACVTNCDNCDKAGKGKCDTCKAGYAVTTAATGAVTCEVYYPSAPTCFPGDTTVTVHGQGATHMASLSVGDRVLVESGEFEPVLSFLHKVPGVAQALTVVHAHGIFRASENHIVFTSRGDMPVSALRPGDELLVQNGPSPILAMGQESTTAGMYAPFTSSGALVVDGVVASSYGTPSSGLSLPHGAAHAAFFALRVYHNLDLAIVAKALCSLAVVMVFPHLRSQKL